MFLERCFFVFFLVKKCEEKRETYDERIIGSTRVNVSIIPTQKSVSVTTCATGRATACYCYYFYYYCSLPLARKALLLLFL